MSRETPREQSVRWPEGQPKGEIHMERSRRICMETMGSDGTRYRTSLTLLRGKKRRGEEGREGEKKEKEKTKEEKRGG